VHLRCFEHICCFVSPSGVCYGLMVGAVRPVNQNRDRRPAGPTCTYKSAWPLIFNFITYSINKFILEDHNLVPNDPSHIK
jgi:hypothetical protein